MTVMHKGCVNCAYSTTNELGDIICANYKSDHIASFREPYSVCRMWEQDKNICPI